VFDEAIVLSRHGGDNVERRLIEPAAAARLFAPHRRKSAAGGRRELRPDRSARRMWLDGPGRQHVLTTVRAGRRRIAVRLGGRTRRYGVELPSLLVEMVWAVRDGRGAWDQVAFVGAYRGRLGERTVLHCPPLPDVDRHGHVCMGSVKLGSDRYAQLDAAAAFEAVFLQTRFADHWLDQCLAEASGYRNLLDALARRRGRVGLDLLQPIGPYGKLFGDLAGEQGQEDGLDREDDPGVDDE